MTFLQKFKCFTFRKIVELQLGRIVKCNNGKCYKTFVWIKWIMRIYYGNIPFIFIVFSVFLCNGVD